MCAYEQAAVPSLFLLVRLIDRHGRRRNNIFVVEIGHHGNDAPWLGADADELDDPVGPPQFAVHRVLPWIEHLCEALTDDDHAFGTVLVAVVEVATLLNRHSERIEESRRYRPELCAEILTVRASGALRGKLEADVQAPIVTPGSAEARTHVLDSRQRADPTLHLAIELIHLFGCPPIRHHRKIQCQNVC